MTVAALACGGSLLAASPASADTITQHCGTYHSWRVCLTYDFTYGYIEADAYNNYSTSEYETVWIGGGNDTVASWTGTIPAGGYGYTYAYTGPPAYECAGVDSVAIVCGSY